jgi:tripartite-type tricarboxylate transporter receptor subunit TctC
MHLTGEYFNASAGVTMMHIPYKGSGLSMPDLISGKIQVVFDSVVSGLQHIQDGKLTAIAVTSKKRVSSIPNVPTMTEIGSSYGLGNFVSEALWAMYGPKNLPPSIVKKLNSDVNQILLMPEVKQELANMGAAPGGGSAQELFQMMLEDRNRWAKVISDQHIVAD